MEGVVMTGISTIPHSVGVAYNTAIHLLERAVKVSDIPLTIKQTSPSQGGGVRGSWL